MKSKISYILLATLLTGCFLLYGCNNGPQSDQGKIIKLEASEIPDNYEEGFFIENKDKTYTPFFTYQKKEGTLSLGDNDEPSPKVLINNETKNEVALVPEIKHGQKIIYVNFTEGKQNDDYIDTSKKLTKMANKGYSIGCKVKLGKGDKAFYISKKDTVTGSNAEEVLDDLGEIAQGEGIKITEINKSEALPYSNISEVSEYLLGLEKGKRYIFGYYQGTRYKEIEIIADTKVLENQNTIELSSALKRTKNGYFIVNLPADLDKGYYLFDGKFLFKVI